MIIYLEACEFGSIFEGFLPENISIYATTSNAVEGIWGIYCPRGSPSSSSEYWTYLGDLYNISWMKDRSRKGHQFIIRIIMVLISCNMVKKKTSVHNTYNHGSHVMQYGELDINEEKLFKYIDSNPINELYFY
ncbi:hypothetical protein M5K25_022545 [Dendrobium thyrsiflorum]|uniref:Gingipain domain-containing protein n=1 Tax=Dendrobium thyrsiflorum TaxID=117978 RepID=A0ABD0UCV6_DENTH